MKLILLLSVFLLCCTAQAQELVYTPKNPAFGGNPYNSQWLLSQAQAQNSFKDNSAENRNQTELERFKSSLNSQLFSQVSRNLFSNQFGDGDLQEGSYTFGSLAVDIYPSEDGLVINILDTNTGEQTQIIIPNS